MRAVRQPHRKRLDNGSLYVLEALVTANNHLRQAGVDEEKRCQLVGHMHDTVNSQVYSSPLEAKKLAETVLEKLQFPDVKALEASLRNELERRVSRQKHEESKATRLGSEADCRAQVIVECADTTSFLTPPLAGIFLPTNSDN